MGYKLKAKTVVGVAVAYDWPQNPDCDICLVDVSKLTVNDKLIEMTEKSFKRPYLARG